MGKDQRAFGAPVRNQLLVKTEISQVSCETLISADLNRIEFHPNHSGPAPLHLGPIPLSVIQKFVVWLKIYHFLQVLTVCAPHLHSLVFAIEAAGWTDLIFSRAGVNEQI